MSVIFYALLFSTLAGLCTTIGSVIAFYQKDPGPRFMAISLGFSAGVMLFVSFVELLKSGIDAIGLLSGSVAFFAGMLIMFAVDNLIPHEYLAEHLSPGKGNSRLAKTGVFVALGIGIHNFPEGLVTFAGTLHSIKLGLAIAVAIALHNIPEGIAISVPVYAATKSRKKAFFFSFLSGLAEPIGTICAILFLLPFLSATVIGVLLAMVAGIMVFISIDELVPVSRSFGEEHLSILGVILGMIIMAASLYLTQL